MQDLIPLFCLLVFIAITIRIRKDALVLIKRERKHAAWVLLISKMMFWFALIEIVYLYFYNALIFILPICLLLFLYYVIVDRKLFLEAIIGTFRFKKLAKTKQ